jgi:hypothetical protein
VCVAVAIAVLKKVELGDLEGGLALLREAVEAARRNPDVRADYREQYAEVLQKWEAEIQAWAGETKNAESPWTKAINGGRCFYWRNDPSGRSQSSLQAPADGVKRVQVEDDDEFEEGFAGAEKVEATQAALAAAGVAFNPESPWVMATNGGRCFYWRNDPSQSSRQAPAEGVKAVQAEDDEEFEKGFAKAEARQAALDAAGVALNTESPWVMATNGGRRYYWRTDPSQSSLQAPAEGVSEVQLEDDEEFEEGFAEAE